MPQKNNKIEQYDFSKLGDRIKFCSSRSGGYDSFCAKTGIPKRTMNNYTAGISDPKSAVLVVIAREANVSIEWLATGSGDVSNQKQTEVVDFGAQGLDDTGYSSGFYSEHISYSLKTSVKSIPLVNIAASAGHGALVYDENNTEIVSFSQEWLHQQRLSPKELFIMPTIGESMEPTIQSGDLLLCSEAEHHKKAGDGIYVVRLDGNILVKRTQVLPGKKIKVSSDNATQFSPYEIELNDGVDFAVIGKVVFILCKRV